ncbi:Dienelactone hydrolase endo--beta-d-glucanase [Mycena kentingensis (nom. inval.)]|nr:Dienelactone hydrolase endo--beta-d-glucanase [Mycena kentingensis (nom. inval.)]
MICDDCFKGIRHEGTPEGRIETLDGVDCYLAAPSGEYAVDKAVLLFTDVFGLALENNKMLADDFARNGFFTIVPDMFGGDPIPPEALDSVTHRLDPSFNRDRWFAAHTPEIVLPIVLKVVDALKTKGITRFAGTGYCFGARPVFDLAFTNTLHVSAITHPGRISVPADLERYATTSTAPLLINSCEVDPAFPADACAAADALFGEGRFAPGYRREWFEGCTHGFAVRGDMSDPRVKKGKEGAFKACVEWFAAHL